MVLGFASCEKGDNGTINNDNNNDNGDSSITFDVSGTIARHDYVDLGLPSCTKWASAMWEQTSHTITATTTLGEKSLPRVIIAEKTVRLSV